MVTLTGKVALNPCLWLFIKRNFQKHPSRLSIHPSTHAESACVTVDLAGSSADEQPERNTVRIMD